MDRATQTQFEKMKVKDVHELVKLPKHMLVERLAEADFPPSEKLIAAVLLTAVDDLRQATADVAASSRQIDRGTGKLITAAWLTLGVAFVTLIVVLVK